MVKIILFCFIVLFQIATVSNVNMSSVYVSWDQNKESDLSGYKIYLGRQSRNYDGVVDVGLDNSYVFFNLEENFPNSIVYFAVTAYDFSGNESGFSKEVSITLNSSENDTVDFNDSFILFQNYPNPFNSYTTFKYKLDIKSFVLLEIFNIKGEVIDQLISQIQDPGEYTINWTPLITSSSGNYILRLSVNGVSKVIKISYVK